MLSWSSLKELFNLIGLPSTVVILVITFYQLGWVPFETQASKGYEAAILAAAKIDANANLIDLSLTQHYDHMKQTEQQLDELLAALREICFNTARDPERLRACGGLTHSTLTLKEHRHDKPLQ